jgi:hypothetical protein
MGPTDDDNQDLLRELLRQYVELLADRNGYAPAEHFEYALWDDLQRHRDLHLLSQEEAAELTSLAIRTDSWVAYNLKARRFQVIDMDAWLLLLDTRGH